MEAFGFTILEIFLWVCLSLTTYAYDANLKNFVKKMEISAPELWEKLGKPTSDSMNRLNMRDLREYVWKREYLSLQNPDLILAGKKCRLFKCFSILSGIALLQFYYIRFILHHT
jgi:hypothetical protein